MLVEDKKLLMRWKKYVENFLSDNTTGIDRSTCYTAEPEDIRLTLEEVPYMIKSLKNHKAPGAMK